MRNDEGRKMSHLLFADHTVNLKKMNSFIYYGF